MEQLFLTCFYPVYHTRLCGGAAEPFYQVGQAGSAHCIWYTRDYFRSALHEVAHWCVAGPARRQQDDYGYWYAPDGRNAQQQQAFQQVEVAPQALEKLFCAAAGHPFRVSLDNLTGDAGDEQLFADAVAARAHSVLKKRGAQRWAQWLTALEGFYRGGVPIDTGLL